MFSLPSLRACTWSALLSLAACNNGERAAPAAPPTATRAAGTSSRAAAPDPTAPTDADGTVVATIDAKRITGFRGWYENGILTLYTGADPNFEYGQKIQFWHLPQIPDGETISFPGAVGSHQAGQMTYAKKDPAVNLSTQWLKDFSYKLQLGKVENYQVKVTLEGQAKSPVQVKISGTIVAMTAGIKIKGGEIDRSYDHLDTIQALTRGWMRKQYQATRIAERADHCFMENAPKKPSKKPRRQVAACSFLYETEAGKPRVAKLWLEKLEGQWAEVKALEPNQLFRAHPIKPTRERPPHLFSPIAARRFEEQIYNKRGGFRRIREPSLFPCGGGHREGHPGWCELKYRVYSRDRTLDTKTTEESACEAVTYLFKADGKGGWRIQKTLDTAQKYNRRTQKVEKREKPPYSCG